MPITPSHFKCTKCAFDSQTAAAQCPSCGAALARVCGACGFTNSPEKIACDGCGARFEENIGPVFDTPPAPPPPKKQTLIQRITSKFKIQPIEDTVTPGPATIKRLAEKPKGNPVVPPRPPSLMDKPVKPANIKKNRKPLIAGLAAAGILLAGGYVVIRPKIPDFILSYKTKQYLNALAANNFSKAYSALADQAKAACTLEEFSAANPRITAFRNVAVFSRTPDRAIVSYEMQNGDSWAVSYITFIRENNRWAYPYINSLFQKADAARQKGLKSQALFNAQTMARIDPQDPRTYGYLCVTEYEARMFQEAVSSCRKPAETVPHYPAGYQREALASFQFYLADSYRFLRDYNNALTEFGALLSVQGVGDDTLCSAYTSTAKIHVNRKDFQSAMTAVDNALARCRAERRNIVEPYKQILSGNAGAKAIEAAKSLSQDGQTPDQIIAAKLAALKRTYALKKLPDGAWKAEWRNGATYDVSFAVPAFKTKTGTKAVQNLFSAAVDLSGQIDPEYQTAVSSQTTQGGSI